MSCDIPAIETARLRLRGPEAGDFRAFAGMMATERATHMGGPFTARQAWAMFSEAVASWHLRGFGGWSVVLRDGGVYVGEVALNHPPDFPEPELGWSLIEGMEGRGYAAEAAEAARRFAARRCGLTRLVSYISPGNARSIRLAERLGAVRDPHAAVPAPGDIAFRHPAPEAAP